MEAHGQFFADKLMDLANLVAAALIFGQLVGGQIVWRAVVVGILFFFGFSMISYLLREKARKQE